MHSKNDINEKISAWKNISKIYDRIFNIHKRVYIIKNKNISIEKDNG